MINVGGMVVLRYGIMCNFVLGLEVVILEGDIWNGFSCLYKDNIGYYF